MLGGDDGGGPSAGRRKAGTSAGGAAVRVDQARTGLPALQFAGPQESSSGVAIGLRGVKSEENRGPDHLLTTTGKARKTALRGRRKINPPFLVALHAESTLDRFLKMFCGTNS